MFAALADNISPGIVKLIEFYVTKVALTLAVSPACLLPVRWVKQNQISLAWRFLWPATSDIVSMNWQQFRRRSQIACPHSAAHRLGYINRCAATRKGIENRVSWFRIKPQQILDDLRRHAAKMAAL